MGLPFIYPDPKLRYVANFLHMMFSMPYEQHVAEPGGRRGAEPDPAAARRPRAELQHLDGARWSGSSQANLFASCAAGVCALWGPLHGGANVAVLEMLEADPQGRA